MESPIKRQLLTVDLARVEWKRSIRIVLAVALMAMSLVGVTSFAPANAALPNVTQLVGGINFNCGLNLSGNALCWGSGNSGDLGNGGTSNTPTPVDVSGGLKFVKLTAGDSSACGLTSGGAAYCWGYGGDGRLGTGSASSSTTPVAVTGAHNFVTIAGENSVFCGVDTSQAAWCWGNAIGFGGLGNGSTSASATPVAVSGGQSFKAIGSGYSFSCGLTTAGAAYCWGRNSGRLGNNDTTDTTTPVPVYGGYVFTSIAVGADSACGLLATGDAYCWGASNSLGQIGDGTTSPRTIPTAVVGGYKFTLISSGWNQTCGITSAAIGYCWGWNANSQLGNGGTTNSSTPIAISGGFNWLSFGLGTYNSCGVTTSGQAECWGDNTYGQIGDGSTTNRTTPTFTTYLFATNTAVASATIDPTLTFTVGSHSGNCNGVTQTAGTTSNASTASLGHIATNSSAAVAQDLGVATNAGSGYTVYIRSISALQSAGHTFNNVSGTNTSPATFTGAGTEAFGYTSNSTTLLTGTANRFVSGGPLWAALTGTNAEVAANTAPTAADTTCVAYEAQTSTTTPAGSYVGTVVYTLVATF